MYVDLFISAIVGIFFTYFFTFIVERFERRIGLLGEDVHKKPGRFLPKSGGLGFLFGWSFSILIYMFMNAGNKMIFNDLITILLIIWFVGIVGLYDDMKRLGGITKVLLTALPGIAIYFASLYRPFVFIPFLGNARLSIVYPILLPIIYAVASNAINMTDTFTGVAPGVVLILTIFTFLSFLFFPLLPKSDPLYQIAIILAVLTISSLIGYLPHNFYPGKSFNGDCGSLSWGAILATIAILSKTEFFLVMAAIPIVTNGFTILSSIKGIIEHHELKTRPTIPDRDNNIIKANPDENAPITLAHLLTLKNPLSEKELVISLYLLVSISSIFTMIFYAILFLIFC
ncbi:hypothetical protein [Fervidicoccus fontis]|nr:hypothetical protein [Fervidicoccus fontis]HEW64385.1 hypothetical protein [Fervidicoccus fontis]